MITYVQLVMITRCVILGQVLTPFHHLLLSIRLAFGQLMAVGLVTVVILAGLAEAHMNALMLQQSAFVDWWGAFVQQFDWFVNGQGYDSTDKGYQSEPWTYSILYFSTSIVLFLILAQFFIAIVVSAHEAATAVEAQMKKDAALPPGVIIARQPLLEELRQFVVYYATGHLYEGTGGHDGKGLLRASRLEIALHRLLAEHGCDQSDHPLLGAGWLARHVAEESLLRAGLEAKFVSHLLGLVQFAPQLASVRSRRSSQPHPNNTPHDCDEVLRRMEEMEARINMKLELLLASRGTLANTSQAEESQPTHVFT